MKGRFVFCIIVTLLVISNGILLFQQSKISAFNVESNENRVFDSQVVTDIMSSVGNQIPLDSIPLNTRIFLRYGTTACGACVLDAEALLENVFGREYVKNNVCIVSQTEDVFFRKQLNSIRFAGMFTPIDTIYTPYFCLTDEKGCVMLAFQLKPRDYEKNREMLLNIKNNLYVESKKHLQSIK